MSYATPQNMIDRFGRTELQQLTDVNDVGDVDTDALQTALDDASAFIDSHLARYALPLSPVPALLVRYCGDIARFYLYDDGVTEAVKTLYDVAASFLKGVENGTKSLGVTAAGVEPTTNDGAQMEGGTRVFSRDDDGFL